MKMADAETLFASLKPGDMVRRRTIGPDNPSTSAYVMAVEPERFCGAIRVYSRKRGWQAEHFSPVSFAVGLVWMPGHPPDEDR